MESADGYKPDPVKIAQRKAEIEAAELAELAALAAEKEQMSTMILWRTTSTTWRLHRSPPRRPWPSPRRRRPRPHPRPRRAGAGAGEARWTTTCSASWASERG